MFVQYAVSNRKLLTMIWNDIKMIWVGGCRLLQKRSAYTRKMELFYHVIILVLLGECCICQKRQNEYDSETNKQTNKFWSAEVVTAEQ